VFFLTCFTSPSKRVLPWPWWLITRWRQDGLIVVTEVGREEEALQAPRSQSTAPKNWPFSHIVCGKVKVLAPPCPCFYFFRSCAGASVYMQVTLQIGGSQSLWSLAFLPSVLLPTHRSQCLPMPSLALIPCLIVDMNFPSP
jgi:hypothetical protein